MVMSVTTIAVVTKQVLQDSWHGSPSWACVISLAVLAWCLARAVTMVAGLQRQPGPLNEEPDRGCDHCDHDRYVTGPRQQIGLPYIDKEHFLLFIVHRCSCTDHYPFYTSIACKTLKVSSIPPCLTTVIRRERVLARREPDGFYYLGEVRHEVCELIEDVILLLN